MRETCSASVDDADGRSAGRPHGRDDASRARRRGGHRRPAAPEPRCRVDLPQRAARRFDRRPLAGRGRRPFSSAPVKPPPAMAPTGTHFAAEAQAVRAPASAGWVPEDHRKRRPGSGSAAASPLANRAQASSTSRGLRHLRALIASDRYSKAASSGDWAFERHEP